MVNFADALKVNVEDVERPPLPPQGHYTFRVSKQPTFGEVGSEEKGMYDTIDFRLQAVEAHEDVDAEDLETAGGVGAINLRHRFMFNQGDDPESQQRHAQSMFNLRRFLTDHLEIDAGDMSMAQAIDASIGHMCKANVQWRQNPNNAEEYFAEIGRTAPVSAD